MRWAKTYRREDAGRAECRNFVERLFGLRYLTQPPLPVERTDQSSRSNTIRIRPTVRRVDENIPKYSSLSFTASRKQSLAFKVN
jgi:hypothetical protein